jgi:hypothetical protein
MLGGNDWLAYESMSRDILVNGVAMTQGAPPGQAQPFYYQPLYPYFLAACHWLTGDGLQGIFFVQRLLVAAGAIAMWRTTAALFGERVAVAGAAAALLVFYGKVAAWSDFLLSEALFIPLLCAWIYLLVRLPSTPADDAVAQAAGAGLIGGLATLTRSTLLLGWLAAIPAVACTVRAVRLRRQVVGILGATLVAVTSLATIRNAIVAHAFVPIASSGPVNLYLGNLPESAVTIPGEHGATYQRFGLDTRTQQVIEYARQRPAAFADGLRRKALYTLGWFEPLMPGSGHSRFYISTWVCALLGLVLVGRRAAAVSMWSVLLPLSIALTQYAAVVLIFPHVYGDRLILPFYVLLVPYVAVALDLLLVSPLVRIAAPSLPPPRAPVG